MPVSFNNFPANWRLPLFWLEVDPSQAGLPINRAPSLMVGQMLASGTGVPNVPIAVGTQAQAQQLFGTGSMIERMFARFFDNNFAQVVYALPVLEPSAGTKATGSLTVATPPTQAGTLFLYIAGQQVQVGISANDTANGVAQKIVTAINNYNQNNNLVGENTLPVTAAMHTTSGAQVDLTCLWKGATGNEIYLMVNYYGAIGGEVYPVGLTLTFANPTLTGGTGAPSFTAAIANLGDQQFDYVAMPFTDSTSLLAWNNEYGFSDTGRWGWMRQLYGMIFSAYRNTFSSIVTWGQTNNSAVLTVMDMEPDVPSPAYEVSAAYCGISARALLNDPARPLQTLELTGILCAPKPLQFTKTEVNVLTTVGMATQLQDANGLMQIQRECTTYQLNSFGISDDSYELVTTMATLWTLFRNMKASITSKYPRHKLADDGTRFGVGQAIVTPMIIKAEIIAEYRISEFEGLVENMAAFKTNLIVERDADNPNRVNVLFPPDLVNQLRTFAVLGQFRLQYNRGVDVAIGGTA